MKRKILWLGLSFLLVAALVLASCAPAVPGEQEEEEEEEEEKLLFAYVSGGDLVGSAFEAAVYRGWKAAVEALGVEPMVGAGCADEAKMLDYVDSMVAAGVDALFVYNWFSADSLHPHLQRALDKGIACAYMSAPDPEFTPAEVSFIGCDMVAQGYRVGKYLAAELKAAGLVSDVNVAIFGEMLGAYATDRRAGILSGLDDEGITYICPETFLVGCDMSVAFDTIKAYLIAHPETDVISGLGDVSTSASSMALRDLGFEPGEVIWSGFDLEPETAAGVIAGYGAVNKDEVFNYGFLAAVACYLRAEHGLIVGDLPIATVMIDQANVEEFLE